MLTDRTPGLGHALLPDTPRAAEVRRGQGKEVTLDHASLPGIPRPESKTWYAAKTPAVKSSCFCNAILHICGMPYFGHALLCAAPVSKTWSQNGNHALLRRDLLYGAQVRRASKTWKVRHALLWHALLAKSRFTKVSGTSPARSKACLTKTCLTCHALLHALLWPSKT